MTAPLPLSAAIITLNEEANLARCLASLGGLVSEIVIVDSGSTDRTRAIAEEAGAIFSVQAWQGHAAQKNFALRLASSPWVLSIDADEAVSPELASSIRNALAGEDPAEDGFWLNRSTFYLGAWIRHAWYPEWRLRLVRKGHAEWHGPGVHERLVVRGRTRRLEGHLLHFSYRNLADHLQRTIHYSQIAAETLACTGRTCRWYNLIGSPWAAFVKHLVMKQGWRDGWRGWIISFSAFVSVFAKYAFLFEKQLTPEGQQDNVNGR